ncbi:MAG: NIF family HAD-type phosphatase [Bacteriovoracaceae bacterium]
MKTVFTLFLFFFFSCLLSCSHGQKTPDLKEANKHFKNHSELILRTTDADFGGFYLDIEKVMRRHNVSSRIAYEIQNQMRDELELIAHSTSRVEQAPFVNKALLNATDNVLNHLYFESGFKPLNFKKNDFVIVFDLDETLLTQWYAAGGKDGDQRKGHLTVSIRDTVVSWADRKTKTSLENATILYSPAMVTMRPNFERLLDEISKLKGYRGFVIFTAKEDKATWDLVKRWEKKYPKTFKNLLGVFTRNYLRFDHNLKKPSKDLRIFDPELKSVALIDDNESRVLQKELCYNIPKFNADYYWDHYSNQTPKSKNWIFSSVLDFVGQKIKACAGKVFSECFQKTLGKNDQDISSYLNWINKRLPRLNATKEEIEESHLFHQKFFIDEQKSTTKVFPIYKKGRYLGY